MAETKIEIDNDGNAACERCGKSLPTKETTGFLMYCAECFQAMLSAGEIIERDPKQTNEVKHGVG